MINQDQILNLCYSTERLLADLLEISYEQKENIPKVEINIWVEYDKGYYKYTISDCIKCERYIKNDTELTSKKFSFCEHSMFFTACFLEKQCIHEPFILAMMQSFFEYMYVVAKDLSIVDGRRRLLPTFDYVFWSSFFSQNIEKKFATKYPLDLFIQISSLSYESKKCYASMCFCNEPPCMDVIFDEGYILDVGNIRQVRKLLELAKGDYTLIENDMIIKGISKDNVPYRFKIDFIGHLTWEFRADTKLIFTYKNGVYKVPQHDSESTLISKLTKEFGDSNNYANILHLYKIFASCEYGALLIITSNVEEDSKRLCSLNRGMSLTPCFIENETLLRSLASIDGAVVVDQSGTIQSVGVILDGKAHSKGLSSRGARYNSAFNYIQIKTETEDRNIAIVFSEDRTIDIIATEDYRGKR